MSTPNWADSSRAVEPAGTPRLGLAERLKGWCDERVRRIGERALSENYNYTDAGKVRRAGIRCIAARTGYAALGLGLAASVTGLGYMSWARGAENKEQPLEVPADQVQIDGIPADDIGYNGLTYDEVTDFGGIVVGTDVPALRLSPDG